MIKFEYYDASELTDEDRQDLWDQDVCMDDWDYLLFSEVEGPMDKIDWIIESDNVEIEFYPADYNVEKLLTGCCNNRWHKVKNFKGRQGVLGVAYHS